MTDSTQPALPGAKRFARRPDAAPNCPSLVQMPTTPTELFYTIGMTVLGPGTYAWPWQGYSIEEGWRAARARLAHFEKFTTSKWAWVPFNGDPDNTLGPMQQSSDPARAFAERVTNIWDALIEMMVQRHLTAGEPLPRSPKEAVERFFGLGAGSLVKAMTDAEYRELSRKLYHIRGFLGEDSNDPKDCIIEARDYGSGIPRRSFATTILSLNRGWKRLKAYLLGKHGQGASNTFQFADLSVIASRTHESPEVTWTIVDKWQEVSDRNPLFRYLTINEEVPSFVPSREDVFPPGTLVRHIGYDSAKVAQPFADKSIYGVMQRTLADPLFPTTVYHHRMREHLREGKPTYSGWGLSRTIRGCVNVLERAEEESVDEDGEEQVLPQKLTRAEPNRQILHRNEYDFTPNEKFDFGGRTGTQDIGTVIFRYWVANPRKWDKKTQSYRADSGFNVLRDWVTPSKPIIFTLDGQTHAEESSTYITDKADLFHVGKYMVVQVCCDNMTVWGKSELFTSTRELLKDTPLKRMILDRLVKVLAHDEELTSLNVELASGPKKTDDQEDDTFADLLEQYCKDKNIHFEQIARRVKQVRLSEDWKEVRDKDRGSSKPPPAIPVKEPPDKFNWELAKTVYTLYPGQTYSWKLATNAAPEYWDNGKIRVFADPHTVVQHDGGWRHMKGGRIKRTFSCPENAVIGSKGIIEARLEYAPGAAMTTKIDIVVVAKPATVRPPGGPNKPSDGDDTGNHGKTKKIKVPGASKEVEMPFHRPFLNPTPINKMRDDTLWASLNWPEDVGYAGFSILREDGKLHVYYNEEFPALIEKRRPFEKFGLADRFNELFKIKLALHTFFALNADWLPDERKIENDTTRVTLREERCTIATDFAYAVAEELKAEMKLSGEIAKEEAREVG